MNMYYNKTLSEHRNNRLNKIIHLIQKAEERNEIINKTTLKHANLGSTITLARDLSLLSNRNEPGDSIITYDNKQRTYRMTPGWKKNQYIKTNATNYESLSILKSLLNQYQNTSLYESVINRVEELAEIPIEEFSRIAVPPKPEYNKEDQKKFTKIFDFMIHNYKIQFYYMGRWHGEEKKNRIVHPYQLLLENGTCYLFGYDEEKKDDRLFVLRRMEQIRLKNGEKFELPTDYEFSARHGFSKFGAYTFKDPVKYKIEFYGNTQIWIKENKWADDQQLKETSDKTVLSFTSSQDDKILEWVLSCGADARPVEPPDFVQRWKDKIRKMAKLAKI